ncbi:UNVERIFIED_CONTAM: hypothetical protein RMT77_015437 [Armadillidium vulgare]
MSHESQIDCDKDESQVVVKIEELSPIKEKVNEDVPQKLIKTEKFSPPIKKELCDSDVPQTIIKPENFSPPIKKKHCDSDVPQALIKNEKFSPPIKKELCDSDVPQTLIKTEKFNPPIKKKLCDSDVPQTLIKTEKFSPPNKKLCDSDVPQTRIKTEKFSPPIKKELDDKEVPKIQIKIEKLSPSSTSSTRTDDCSVAKSYRSVGTQSEAQSPLEIIPVPNIFEQLEKAQEWSNFCKKKLDEDSKITSFSKEIVGHRSCDRGTQTAIVGSTREVMDYLTTCGLNIHEDLFANNSFDYFSCDEV